MRIVAADCSHSLLSSTLPIVPIAAAEMMIKYKRCRCYFIGAFVAALSVGGANKMLLTGFGLLQGLTSSPFAAFPTPFFLGADPVEGGGVPPLVWEAASLYLW